MTNLPTPLVPEDCDLSGMDSMMLDVGRLRKSRLSLVARRRPEFGWISVLLWGAAWEETPPASIENDDDVLADRAMVSPERWAELKDDILRPWILCSNGRWYHPVVAEKANELWAGRLHKRHEMENGRAVKAWKATGKQGDAPKIEFLPWLQEHFPVTFAMRQAVFGPDKGMKTDKPAPVTEQIEAAPASVTEAKDQSSPSVTASVTEQKTPEISLKEKVKVNEKVKENENTSVEAKASTGASAESVSRETKPAWWPQRDRYGRVTSEVTEKIMFDVGKAVLGNSAGGQITKMRKAYSGDMRAVVDFLLQADEKSTPAEWFAGVLRKAEIGRHENAKHEIYPKETHPA